MSSILLHRRRLRALLLLLHMNFYKLENYTSHISKHFEY